MDPAADLAQLLSRLSKEAIPAPQLTFEASLSVPAHDDPSDGSDPSPPVIGLGVLMHYRDTAGERSRRRITIRALDRQPHDIRILAFCHERQAARLFMASRVEELIELQTGTVVEDPDDWFKRAMQLVEAAEDRVSATRRAVKRCRTGLHILTYIARCDGNFHPLEREVMIDYVQQRCRDIRFDRSLMAWLIDRLYPDQEVWAFALSRLKLEGLEGEATLRRYIRHVVSADGRLAHEEFQSLLQIPG